MRHDATWTTMVHDATPQSLNLHPERIDPITNSRQHTYSFSRGQNCPRNLPGAVCAIFTQLYSHPFSESDGRGTEGHTPLSRHYSLGASCQQSSVCIIMMLDGDEWTMSQTQQQPFEPSQDELQSVNGSQIRHGPHRLALVEMMNLLDQTKPGEKSAKRF